MQKKAVSVDLLRGFMTLIKHASEFIEKQAEKEERIANAVPNVVEGLIDRGLVDSIDKEAMTKQLLDHEKCLLAVKTAAKHAQPATMGSGVSVAPTNDEKRAGYSPERESDRRFEQRILG